MTSNIIYPDEDDILQLRKGFELSSHGYLSKGSFRYILDTVHDLYNEQSFEEALIAKAAYILFNIVISHPFIDGNKRTAYGAANIFLRVNGYRISVCAKTGTQFIARLATGQFDEAKVQTWIRQHLKKLNDHTTG